MSASRASTGALRITVKDETRCHRDSSRGSRDSVAHTNTNTCDALCPVAGLLLSS